MKLYEIDREISKLIDEDSGEVLDFEKLESLQMEKTKKIEHLALKYKELMAEANALESEKKSFAERESKTKNKAESVKSFLAYVLNGNKFKTNLVEIGFRKSEKVNIISQNLIPEKFLKFQDPVVDKAAIKQELKLGKEIPGCELQESKNIQIK